ncbi:hypothetical protein HanRHA438_Chr09g0399681 [Helianthus annuus]|nr:hypothetical protein HanRHA438_Chr09g0399681 [Helianthus annuus]
MNFPDVDVDEADVAPIDAVNDVDEQPDGGVLQFVRMRLPDLVSRMARLDEGLKDITVRLMHLDPPQQFTNGTRRERNNETGFRYALTRWSKFMKSARIKNATSLLVLNEDLIFLHLILLWMTLMMMASLSKAQLMLLVLWLSVFRRRIKVNIITTKTRRRLPLFWKICNTIRFT